MCLFQHTLHQLADKLPGFTVLFKDMKCQLSGRGDSREWLRRINCHLLLKELAALMATACKPRLPFASTRGPAVGKVLSLFLRPFHPSSFFSHLQSIPHSVWRS